MSEHQPTQQPPLPERPAAPPANPAASPATAQAAAPPAMPMPPTNPSTAGAAGETRRQTRTKAQSRNTTETDRPKRFTSYSIFIAILGGLALTVGILGSADSGSGMPALIGVILAFLSCIGALIVRPIEKTYRLLYLRLSSPALSAQTSVDPGSGQQPTV